MKNLPTTQIDWHKRLDTLRDKSVKGILDFAEGVYQFSTFCEKKQGGTMFASLMKAWYGMSQQTASQWKILGEQRSQLTGATSKFDNLPPSFDSLYKLCKLPAPRVEEIVEAHPKASQQTIRKATKQVKAEPTKEYEPKPEPPKPEPETYKSPDDFGETFREMWGEPEPEPEYDHSKAPPETMTIVEAQNVLGIGPLTEESLNVLVRYYSSKFHPDKGNGNPAMFDKVRRAKKVLTKEMKR